MTPMNSTPNPTSNFTPAAAANAAAASAADQSASYAPEPMQAERFADCLRQRIPRADEESPDDAAPSVVPPTDRSTQAAEKVASNAGAAKAASYAASHATPRAGSSATSSGAAFSASTQSAAPRDDIAMPAGAAVSTPLRLPTESIAATPPTAPSTQGESATSTLRALALASPELPRQWLLELNPQPLTGGLQLYAESRGGEGGITAWTIGVEMHGELGGAMARDPSAASRTLSHERLMERLRRGGRQIDGVAVFAGRRRGDGQDGTDD